MRIIAKSLLREFWEARKADAEAARRAFSAWYKLAETGEWANFADLKQTFPSADRVGECVVFDVGNNRYRLVCWVKFEAGIVYTRKAMDHAEYDLNRWVGECNCHGSIPKRKPGMKRKPAKKLASKRKRGG